MSSTALKLAPAAPAVPTDVQVLSGAQKGFLLLISLDESIATRILGYLSDDELKILRKASEQVREVSAATRLLVFLAGDEVKILRKASEQVREVSAGTLLALHKEFAARANEGAPTTL